MGQYSHLNAGEVLKKVRAHITELEQANNLPSWELDYHRFIRKGRTDKATVLFKVNQVYKELSIFDWWKDTLSMSQLKQMEKFLVTAIDLGFTGKVSFKVGAAGCSHGMWAHKEESTDGYDPKGDALFHSFQSGDNFWNVRLNGKWLPQKNCGKYTLAEVKKALA